MLSDKTSSNEATAPETAPEALPCVVSEACRDGAPAPSGFSPAPHAESVVADNVPALDGVRAIAVMLVVVHHFMTFADLRGIEQPLFGWAKYAWFGVDLFFVLSGFLITRILLKAKESPNYFKSFFARRCLRIWPLYYGFLLVVMVILPNLLNLHLSVKAEPHALWFWTNLQNFCFVTFGFQDRTTNVMWSLAIEEQFYLIWPFFVRFLPKRALWAVLGVAVAGSLITRCVLFAQNASDVTIYLSTFTRLDTIATGCVLALAMSYDGFKQFCAKVGRHQNALFIATLIGFAGYLACQSDWRDHTVLGQVLGYSITAVLSAMLIFTTLVSSKRSILLRFLENPAIVLIGKISFGIYVFHRTVEHLLSYFLFPLFEKYIPQAPSIALLISLSAVTFVVAWASYHLYEMQFLKLKRYFDYAKPKSESTAP